MLLARIGAPVLASCAAGLPLPISVVEASGAAVASLQAEGALVLTSRDRRGWWAEGVLWFKTALALHEAESREGTVKFLIHIILTEATLGSHGAFTVLHAMLVCWRGTDLVPVGTVIGSRVAYLGLHRTCLASHEAMLGS